MNLAAADAATILLSLETALAATALAGVFGLLAAALMAGRAFPGKALVDGLLIAPMVLPPTVVGFLLLLLMGQGGPLGHLAVALFGETLLFTWPAAVVAAAVVAMPLFYRTVRSALEQIDTRLPAAARTLGASEARIFFQILLPLSRPGIVAGTLLAFARALGEFGATLMVAGNLPGKTRTLPLAIYMDVETGNMARAGLWVAFTLVLGVGLSILANYWGYGGFRRARKRSEPPIVESRKPFLRSIATSPIVVSEIAHGERSLTARVIKVLPNFRLDVELGSKGRAIAVLGPSGAGKSLLLSCLAGLTRPDEGAIVVNGRVVFDRSANIFVPAQQRRVGHVFQSYALFPHLTVAENLAFGLTRISPDARRAKVQSWLEALDLGSFADALPDQLSGGQAQRAAIGRALAPKPDLLLLDEPLSALDTHLKSRIEQHLAEVIRDFRGVTLLVTHNLEEAFRLCDDLIVLDEGRVIASGDKHIIVEDPGTVTTATLTGCKNIVRLGGAEDGRLLVPDWGVELNSPVKAGADITHLGIRAYHVRLAAKDPQTANTFACRLVSASATPHRMTLFLALAGGTVPLQVEVLKDVWETLRQAPESWHLTLPPDRLLLLRGTP